jgi:hypothetical protein
MRPVRSAPLVRRRLILVIALVVSCLGTCLCGIANASVTLGSKLSALFDSATGSQNVYYATPSGALREGVLDAEWWVSVAGDGEWAGDVGERAGGRV